MSAPSIKRALQFKAALDGKEGKPLTIGCIHCKAPLWDIEIKGIYGTRVNATKTPYPGVPEYSEYWDKDQKTALRTDCPKCGHEYIAALVTGQTDPDGNPIIFPKVYTLQYQE
jgi:hypothetical protein